jgi:hypothetical protein
MWWQPRLRGFWSAPLTIALCCCGGAASAGKATFHPSSARLGVYSDDNPSDLRLASAAGVGLLRTNADLHSDAKVEFVAAARLRMYAILGLPRGGSPAGDAPKIARLVSAFAGRYGPYGVFWKQHPTLPYLPVQSFEIGNEPNVPLSFEPDSSTLQYGSPAGYAKVYEAARTALHRVDPTGKAVVGGMLDSGGVPLRTTEAYLAALGPIDAVGFHPYLYDEAAMERDTLALRRWLNAHGHAQTPIDVNEFAAAPHLGPTIAVWGAEVAGYTHWALCTPGLGVETVIPFWWGATGYATESPSFPWYPMVNPRMRLTPLGRDYLGMAKRLTTRGC